MERTTTPTKKGKTSGKDAIVMCKRRKLVIYKFAYTFVIFDINYDCL